MMLRFSMLLAAILAAAAASAQVAPPSPPPCSAPDHRAFDFWVGEWDVYPGNSGTQVATSSIEAMFDGCAIRETWKPFKGGGGGSFSHYDKERRHWRQAWVDRAARESISTGDRSTGGWC